MNKRGKWSLPKIVLKVENETRKITVTVKFGRLMSIAVEEFRIALLKDSFANTV